MYGYNVPSWPGLSPASKKKEDCTCKCFHVQYLHLDQKETNGWLGPKCLQYVGRCQLMGSLEWHFMAKDTRFSLFQSVWAACHFHHSLLLGIWWDVINPGDRQNHESGTICVVARKKFIFLTIPLQGEMHNLCQWCLYRWNVVLTCGYVYSNYCSIGGLRLSPGWVREGPPEFEPGNSEMKY